MTILFVLNSTSTTAGATKSFLLLLRGLVNKGHKTIVVVPDDGELCAVLPRDSIECHVLNYRPTVYPPHKSMKDRILFFPRIVRYSLKEKKAVAELVKICESSNVDIIHTNVSVETVGIKAAKILDIPHVMHFREYADKDFDMHYFPSKDSLYSLVDTEKSYSVCITKGIEEYHRLNPERTRQIYNAITFNGINNDNDAVSSDGQRYILYAGRIEPAKGVKELLEAFNDAKTEIDASIKLKLAGDVNDRQYMDDLLRFVKSSALDDRVEFLGGVKNIVPLMKNALAIVVPSKFEAFGRCLPEAMISGCLTIGRNTAGTKEQLDNGAELFGKEIGLRFNTTAELKTHIVNVCNNEPHYYAEMKERAKQTVEQLYSIRQYVDGVENLYCEIIKNQRK